MSIPLLHLRTLRGGVVLVASVVALGCSAPRADSPATCASARCPTLTVTQREPAGANCADGGTAVRSGRDTNADGSLSDSEATQTLYVSDGAPGKDGADSPLPQVSTRPASNAQCSGGGYVLAVNGVETVLCNGPAGAQPAVGAPMPSERQCAVRLRSSLGFAG